MVARRATRASSMSLGLLHRLGDRICSHATEDAMVPASVPSVRKGPAWFVHQLDEARRTVVDVLQERGYEIAGRSIGDIASADGALSLAMIAAGARRVVAFDEDRTDLRRLEDLAVETGEVEGLPAQLEARAIMEGGLPCEDDEFDVVVSGGPFMRLRWLTRVTGEVRRVLRPEGAFLVHVGPFFDSSRGGLLPDELGPWAHQLEPPDVIDRRVRRLVSDPAHADGILDRFGRLNRVTLDEVHQTLLVGGFDVTWARLDAPAVDIPTELQHRPLSALLPTAATLLAVPRKS
jgi:SAM-dependent methyltransferase